MPNLAICQIAVSVEMDKRKSPMLIRRVLSISEGTASTNWVKEIVKGKESHKLGFLLRFTSFKRRTAAVLSRPCLCHEAVLFETPHRRQSPVPPRLALDLKPSSPRPYQPPDAFTSNMIYRRRPLTNCCCEPPSATASPASRRSRCRDELPLTEGPDCACELLSISTTVVNRHACPETKAGHRSNCKLTKAKSNQI